MKLTWFGGTTIRVHIGGQMLVADPGLAPSHIDAAELVSGADRLFRLIADPALEMMDPAKWRPRPAPLPIDDVPPAGVELHRIAIGSVLIDALGEPPLVLVGDGQPPDFARWADGAVIVLFGAGEMPQALGRSLLHSARPRLLALASPEAELDVTIAALRPHLDGAALLALEPGLALEV